MAISHGMWKAWCRRDITNCIDIDVRHSAFDIELDKHISENVSIPVIASSGAGKVKHLLEVFKKTKAEADLAAEIFPREEVLTGTAEKYLQQQSMELF